MKYNPLGRTGLFVSELCLGTMTFGGDDQGIWGKIGRLQQEESERIIGGAVDAGINFIDTADVYAGGRSEEITGQALKNLKLPRENVKGKALVIYWSYQAEREDYQEGGGIGATVKGLASVFAHFFTRTRWDRMLHQIR